MECKKYQLAKYHDNKMTNSENPEIQPICGNIRDGANNQYSYQIFALVEQARMKLRDSNDYCGNYLNVCLRGIEAKLKELQSKVLAAIDIYNYYRLCQNSCKLCTSVPHEGELANQYSDNLHEYIYLQQLLNTKNVLPTVYELLRSNNEMAERLNGYDKAVFILQYQLDQSNMMKDSLSAINSQLIYQNSLVISSAHLSESDVAEQQYLLHAHSQQNAAAVARNQASQQESMIYIIQQQENEVDRLRSQNTLLAQQLQEQYVGLRAAEAKYLRIAQQYYQQQYDIYYSQQLARTLQNSNSALSCRLNDAQQQIYRLQADSCAYLTLSATSIKAGKERECYLICDNYRKYVEILTELLSTERGRCQRLKAQSACARRQLAYYQYQTRQYAIEVQKLTSQVVDQAHEILQLKALNERMREAEEIPRAGTQQSLCELRLEQMASSCEGRVGQLQGQLQHARRARARDYELAKERALELARQQALLRDFCRDVELCLRGTLLYQAAQRLLRSARQVEDQSGKLRVLYERFIVMKAENSEQRAQIRAQQQRISAQEHLCQSQQLQITSLAAGGRKQPAEYLAEQSLYRCENAYRGLEALTVQQKSLIENQQQQLLACSAEIGRLKAELGYQKRNYDSAAERHNALMNELAAENTRSRGYIYYLQAQLSNAQQPSQEAARGTGRQQEADSAGARQPPAWEATNDELQSRAMEPGLVADYYTQIQQLRQRNRRLSEENDALRASSAAEGSANQRLHRNKAKLEAALSNAKSVLADYQRLIAVQQEEIAKCESRGTQQYSSAHYLLCKIRDICKAISKSQLLNENSLRNIASYVKKYASLLESCYVGNRGINLYVHRVASELAHNCLLYDGLMQEIVGWASQVSHEAYRLRGQENYSLAGIGHILKKQRENAAARHQSGDTLASLQARPLALSEQHHNSIKGENTLKSVEFAHGYYYLSNGERQQLLIMQEQYALQNYIIAQKISLISSKQANALSYRSVAYTQQYPLFGYGNFDRENLLRYELEESNRLLGQYVTLLEYSYYFYPDTLNEQTAYAADYLILKYSGANSGLFDSDSDS